MLACSIYLLPRFLGRFSVDVDADADADADSLPPTSLPRFTLEYSGVPPLFGGLPTVLGLDGLPSSFSSSPPLSLFLLLLFLPLAFLLLLVLLLLLLEDSLPEFLDFPPAGEFRFILFKKSAALLFLMEAVTKPSALELEFSAFSREVEVGVCFLLGLGGGELLVMILLPLLLKLLVPVTDLSLVAAFILINPCSWAGLESRAGFLSLLVEEGC